MRVLTLAKQYRPKDHHREMGYDGLLFGYLDACFGKMKRQHQIHIGKSRRPKRIDYRQGGTSPVLIEFAARTPNRNEIYGSQNRDEIQKLTRQKSASARYLLLLDMSGKSPIDRDQLRDTYREISSGKGNFKRMPVQVVYLHPNAEPCSFLWRPKA